MKTFFATLAMVSALLIADSKADDTAANCTHPKKDTIEAVELFKKERGYKSVELKGPAAQAYLSVIRATTEAPHLPGVELLVVYNEGVAAVVFAIKGEFRCGYARVPWDLHIRAMIAADRTNI